MKKISWYLSFVYAMLLCTPSFAQDKEKYVELSQLRDMMTGDFRSMGKAQVGRQHDYVVLQSRPIWQDRSDGYWLYLEQFAAADDKLPAVQTVLHFYVTNNRELVCETYTLTDPSAFANATRQQSQLLKLSYAGLKKSDACPLYFQQMGNAVFNGKIPEATCAVKVQGQARFWLALAQNEITVSNPNVNLSDGQSVFPIMIAAKYQRILPE